MKHRINGFIVDGPDIIDIGLRRRRLRQDRLELEVKRLYLVKKIQEYREQIEARQKLLDSLSQ